MFLRIIPVFVLIQVASCITWFELRLLKFDNPSGREEDGDCCDFPCSDPCDPDFLVCFDKPDEGECTLAKRYTGHYHANTFSFQPRFENGEDNPMKVKMDEPWPRALYVTIRVEDRDSTNANDPMGTLRKLLTRVPAPDERTATWNNIDFIFKYQTITAQARVYCDKNYHGDDCSRFCEPKNSETEGHFSCTEAGEKKCMEHWHGADCKTFCRPSDNELSGHYVCGPHGEVICLNGWQGATCTEDIDECANVTSNPCYPNGICNNTRGGHTCTCNDFFVGRNCKEIRLYCDDLPCSNNSVCNDTAVGFQCICNPKWTGSFCDERVTPCTLFPCKNGGKCNVISGDMYECACIGKWEGRDCDQEAVILYNDTKTLFLKGQLPTDQWDDFTFGIGHLLKDLLKIEDATIETTFSYPDEEQTKCEIFVQSSDPAVMHSLDKIFMLPEDELKTSLILPVLEKQISVVDKQSPKPDSWVKKHWYVVLIVVAVLIAVMTAVVAIMYNLKRRRQKLLGKGEGFDSTRNHSGRDSIISLSDSAVGFDNSLYFQSKDPEKLRGLPEIPNGHKHENGRK
ncbi:protein jagged-1-like [Dreissena polymorpha]|uniref:Delta-like protein n=1 Tax=Dreissena polymorpha TaxID=45954 RepID=A0A9D4JQJ9_DREPO|nr:protein jagged-1-like [Dreissena polymorpha]KAH3820895.1 hypothetical protein DPMN_122644 [Dreissena polymorpha]